MTAVIDPPNEGDKRKSLRYHYLETKQMNTKVQVEVYFERFLYQVEVFLEFLANKYVSAN